MALIKPTRLQTNRIGIYITKKIIKLTRTTSTHIKLHYRKNGQNIIDNLIRRMRGDWKQCEELERATLKYCLQPSPGICENKNKTKMALLFSKVILFHSFGPTLVVFYLFNFFTIYLAGPHRFASESANSYYCSWYIIVMVFHTRRENVTNKKLNFARKLLD